MLTNKMYSVAVGQPANQHETAPRRNAKAAKQPITTAPGNTTHTVYDFVMENIEKFGDRNCMAHRDVIEIHEEEKTITKKSPKGEDQIQKKTWMYYELSPYKYESFKEVGKIINAFGRGLVHIGMKPNSDDKLHIYGQTSHKWMKSFLGSQSQSIPIATAYDTLGEKGLVHSMNQTGSVAIATDNNLLQSLINPLKSVPSVRYIIHFDEIKSSDKRQNGKLYLNAHNAVEKIKEIRPDIQVFSFNDILDFGDSHPEIPLTKPKPDDLSCIMYTSGSTGEPKGVVLKHKNIIAGVGGVALNVLDYVGASDRIISFLPLAHILEMAFELLCFHWGSCIGYGTVKTLTKASIKNCNSDLEEFKPTIMVGVAAVWETVKKGIINQINALPKPIRAIFWSAYYTKSSLDQYHLPGGNLISKLIFKRVKEATGGHLRYLLNGGSAISVDAQKFLTTLLCPLLIGYGLTETCASVTVLDPRHFEFGVAGDLTGCVTVKLVDAEELGYFAKNNQGEILVKGDNVMSEYFKNEKETRESLTSDGWFQTGDIGEWSPNGHLKIIDRKKNLVKTLNGEYIALEKLESVYRSNSYVQNICVYADPNQVKPVGIIVPNLVPLAKLAKDIGVMKSNEDVTHYIHNQDLQRAVHEDMLASGKKQGLAGIELLQGVVFFDDEWTPQNGFVTSAQKLKRNEIVKKVKEYIDQVYEQ